MAADNKRDRRQMDDNIDDLGRRPDGTTLDQPGTDKLKPIKPDTVEAERDADENDERNPSPMNPAFP
ncbi:hypothetical protein [Devosia sp. A16]|uniref:hypothetical protein n=1 Tax=Devosia sp. A16 TaxID=1736675 RepID=UPI0006D7EAB7|nr:hypothetical protein [Devosia sp. A16]